MPYPTQTWIILPKIEGYQNKREEAVLGGLRHVNFHRLHLTPISFSFPESTDLLHFPSNIQPLPPISWVQLKAHNLIPPTAMAQAGVQIWMFWALQGADAHQEPRVWVWHKSLFTHMHITLVYQNIFWQKTENTLKPISFTDHYENVDF